VLPPRLARELEELRHTQRIEVREEDDYINIVIPEFPTGPEFSYPTTTVLLRVPRAYPDAGLDMFWTDLSLTLAGGGIPQNAEVHERYMERDWRRFSWHHNGWNAAINNLHSYLEFVRRRFRER
jgi:hypothetical protein